MTIFGYNFWVVSGVIAFSLVRRCFSLSTVAAIEEDCWTAIMQEQQQSEVQEKGGMMDNILLFAITRGGRS
jgi:hypothetical protein